MRKSFQFDWVRHRLPAMARAVAIMALVGCLTSQVHSQVAVGERSEQEQAAALERVSKAVEYLASDELEGRGPDTKGLETAGAYCEQEFKDIGLKPMPNGSYRQSFEIPMGGPTFNRDSAKLVFKHSGGNIELTLDEDFSPQLSRRSTVGNGGLVFVGYGINSDEYNYNEYRNVEVEGKYVVVLRKEPQQKNADSVFNGREVSEHAYVQSKVDAARNAGAAGIIFVNDSITVEEDGKDVIEPNRNRFNITGRTFAFAHVTRRSIENLLEKTPVVLPNGSKLSTLKEIEKQIDETLEPLSQELKGWEVDYVAEMSRKGVEIFNVVGMLEGNGPNKDEIILVGGHYDHLGYGGYGSMAPGRKEIHNGADDNATGTVAVIELARRFASRDDRPNRTMVFACFSGEERGLHGSRYYANNPPWALDKTIAMINFDMIGYLRNGELDLIHGQSGDVFERLFNEAAEGLDLNLKIGSSAQANSDHWEFYQKKVPDVFIHTGITSVLHTPEDDYELCNMEGAMTVIDFTERFMIGLDRLEEAPQFVDLRGRSRRMKSSFGAQIDYDNPDGPIVLKVTEDSAAEKAGIKKGDILVYFDNTKVTSARTMMTLLGKDPGTEIEVKLKRNGEMQKIKMKLGER